MIQYIFGIEIILLSNLIQKTDLSNEERLLLQWKKQDPSISDTKFNQLLAILHQPEFNLENIPRNYKKIVSKIVIPEELVQIMDVVLMIRK